MADTELNPQDALIEENEKVSSDPCPLGFDWYIANAGSNLYKITLGLNGSGYYYVYDVNLTVSYGNGEVGSFVYSGNQNSLVEIESKTSIYYKPGTYTVKITGGYIRARDQLSGDVEWSGWAITSNGGSSHTFEIG